MPVRPSMRDHDVLHVPGGGVGVREVVEADRFVTDFELAVDRTVAELRVRVADAAHPERVEGLEVDLVLLAVGVDEVEDRRADPARGRERSPGRN